jgi:hypothetical protein
MPALLQQAGTELLSELCVPLMQKINQYKFSRMKLVLANKGQGLQHLNLQWTESL